MKPDELAKFALRQVGLSLASEIEDKAPNDPELRQEVEAFIKLCSNASERGYDVACVVRISFAAQSRYPGQAIHNFEPQPEFRQHVSVNGKLLGGK